MTPRDFVAGLSEVMEIERTELATVDRALAKKGLRQLARGRFRPDITLTEGVQLACAWAGAENLTLAASEVGRLNGFVALTELVDEEDQFFAQLFGYGPREVPSKTFLDLVSMAARQLGAGKYPAKELWVNIEKCCSVDIIYRDDSGRTNLLFEYPFFSCPPEGISIFEHRRNVKVRVTINGAVFKWIFEVTEGA
ncbi:hypothetical protein ROG8370_02678 [Roseovarius gaetbuli]|uniref:Uncharacterized protein n=1 Tax=Roseovarius gaetbuli TaxID=1356575 RepID=A0A1X6ZR04_9RHOB|nr:hypothetical protein [Roseovarius gaetbuli]SLN58721.1 hypothetical protein ROG8370_02678 [Roseovarius gaetbuli]